MSSHAVGALWSVQLLHTGAFPPSRWQGQFWSPGKQKDDFLSIDELKINASPNPFCLYQLTEEWPFAEVAGLWSLQWYGALCGDVKTCGTKLGKTLMFSDWNSVGWGSKQQSVQLYSHPWCRYVQCRELSFNREHFPPPPLPSTVTFWYSSPTHFPVIV